ncbi:MAG: winged helix DNA-binding protein [Qipengyuania sp.]|nr:winged helix DNA-binding protein [Qipengyuania sp.]
MVQAAFLCEGERDAAASLPVDVLAPTASLFGDPGRLAGLAGDARRAGLAVRAARPLESLLRGDGGVLGDIVLVDCPEVDGACLAALIRLDQRVARAGAQLVAIASVASLEDVFGCLEGRDVRILVDPTPAQAALALGGAMLNLSHGRVRELHEGERLELLRLTEEVGRLAATLDRLALPLGSEGAHGPTARLASPANEFGAPGGEARRDLMRRPRPPLPDPRLVHRIIRQRRLRDRYFESELFADPAWDILLDLTAARAEHRRVSVTSLCIAAAVPATTALRWIAQMSEMGILVREQDEEDKRRAFIALSDNAADAMARYFDELGKDAAKLI